MKLTKAHVKGREAYNPELSAHFCLSLHLKDKKISF